MDLKNRVTWDSYRIVAAPNGGFIAHPSIPALETIEGPTLEDVERQILAQIEAADAKNPLGASGKFESRTHTTFSKFSYHIEEKPQGGFIARPSDPAMEVIEGVTREGVQQRVQEKLRALLGEQRIPCDPLGQSEINLTVNRKASFKFVPVGASAPSGNTAKMISGDGDSPKTLTLKISNPGRILAYVAGLAVLAALAYFYFRLSR